MIDKSDIDEEIDSLADLTKNLVNTLYPFYYGFKVYNSYIQELKRLRKQREILIVKYYTLGLTYFKKQRLKELT